TCLMQIWLLYEFDYTGKKSCAIHAEPCQACIAAYGGGHFGGSPLAWLEPGRPGGQAGCLGQHGTAHGGWLPWHCTTYVFACVACVGAAGCRNGVIGYRA